MYFNNGLPQKNLNFSYTPQASGFSPVWILSCLSKCNGRLVTWSTGKSYFATNTFLWMLCCIWGRNQSWKGMKWYTLTRRQLPASNVSLHFLILILQRYMRGFTLEKTIYLLKMWPRNQTFKDSWKGPHRRETICLHWMWKEVWPELTIVNTPKDPHSWEILSLFKMWQEI